MRITCPNCRAQYDVDPSMIPEAGRDVQCSNCAHTWFQTRAGGDDADDAPLPEEIEAEEASAAAPDDAPETPEEVTGEGPHAEDVAAGPDEDGSDEDNAITEDVADADAPRSAAAPEVDRGGAPVAGEIPAERDDRLRAAIDRPREKGAEPDLEESETFRAEMREAVTEPGPPEETATGADRESAPDIAPAEPADAWDEIEQDAVGEGDSESKTDPVSGPISGPDPDHEIETEADTEPPRSTSSARLDEDVAEILREEAELEANRRRTGEAPPAFDMQGDLALDEGRPSSILRERLDRMRGDGVPEPTIAASAAMAGTAEATRRDRLPDIEEINSTLRPNTGGQDDEAPVSPAEITAVRRSGFRTGFATIVLLAAVLVGAYVYAPQIIRAVPAAEAALISYVDIANTARDHIDGLMARAISEINGVVGDGANGA